MKALIAFYSQSGNTAIFAKKILDVFRKAGVDCEIELIKPIGRVHPGMKAIEFKNELTDISSYDLLLLGGPVWAFDANPPLRIWTKRFGDLSGKKAALFFTQGGMGGKRAVKTMTELLSDRGANVLAAIVQSCFIFVPNKAMDRAAEDLCMKVLGK